MLFSIVVIPVYSPTSSAWRVPFFFFRSLPTWIIPYLFDNSGLNRCKVISHCNFDLHFPDDSVQFNLVQSLSHVRLFVTPWTAARQASLSHTISWNLPKFMSIASVMPSSHLIHWHPLLLSLNSVAHLCLTICDTQVFSTPWFPVHHQLPELAQTHVHRVSDAI